ncbi:uncharacterized protein [Acropora muricata]|uniref:uncharacterized protein n=1 Tax=Acropora muricata TaxID=159855 RepID=UPI0034E4F5E7
MGECADDIITTLRVNEETASYTDVRAALNGYFAARRNTIVERARFNTRKQTPEESVGTFIQDLYCIADDCKNQVIRDRIVVGVLDDALSDRLQAKSDLTLADAVRMSREAKPRKQSCEEKRSPAMLRSLATLITSISPYQFVPGKHQAAAGALSRTPVGTPELEDELFSEEVEASTTQVTARLPATAMRLQEIQGAQEVDEECSQVRVYSLQGWPAFMPHQPLLRPYQEGRSHFSAVDYLLMYDDRLVIPRGMTLQILDCIHTGHLGITKCRSRAHTSVWWPGISKQTKCITCAKDRPTPKEPLMSASLLSRPWERIATDLFEWNGKVYLIVTDYYSR